MQANPVEGGGMREGGKHTPLPASISRKATIPLKIRREILAVLEIWRQSGVMRDRHRGADLEVLPDNFIWLGGVGDLDLVPAELELCWHEE
jgi:hypothetical protein